MRISGIVLGLVAAGCGGATHETSYFDAGPPPERTMDEQVGSDASVTTDASVDITTEPTDAATDAPSDIDTFEAPVSSAPVSAASSTTSVGTSSFSVDTSVFVESSSQSEGNSSTAQATTTTNIPRTDCEWCVPGESSCNADGIRLQKCVDDGDGCGHWEEGEVCERFCAEGHIDRPDELGNWSNNLGSRCYDFDQCDPLIDCSAARECDQQGKCEPFADDAANCFGTVICDQGESCSSETAECEVADTWLTASAQFEDNSVNAQANAAREELSGLCDDSGCSVILEPKLWRTMTNGFPVDATVRVASVSVNEIPVANLVGCDDVQIDMRDWFATETVCSVSFDDDTVLESGGHVDGYLNLDSVLQSETDEETAEFSVTARFQLTFR